MTQLAIPLLRTAAVLGIPTAHPWLGRLSGLSVELVTRAARTTEDGPWCVDDGCHGFQYCPDSFCNGMNCNGGLCIPANVGCESGGTCWTIENSSAMCCDCWCCHYAFGCFYCICGPV